MKKIFLYIIAFLLVLTSIFVLQHIPISSYEEPDYEVSIPSTEETPEQMVEGSQEIELPVVEETEKLPVKKDTDIKVPEKTEKLSVKENTDVEIISVSEETQNQPVKAPQEPISLTEEVQKQPEEKIVTKSPQDPLPIKEEEVPAEETEEVEQGTFCTIEIICDQVLANMEKLPEGKAELIPADGVILAQTKAEFFEEETVFNVTSRELKARKIHIDFVYTPMYNSVYIKGINNLYEKDCTAGSGWVYTVNGQSTNCGASAYKLKDGDKVQWTYIIR